MSSKQIVLRSLMFFIILVVAGVSQGAIRKGPYLIYPGRNTEMMVLWQLDSSQSCSLEWGLDPNYSGGSVVTAEYGTDHQHKHTIPGLVPSSKYYYRVIVDVNEYPGSFRAAPPEDVNAVQFLAYGDTRTNVFDHDMVDAAMIATFEADPNYHTITLLSGDWVDNGEEEGDWTDEFFNPAALNTRRLQANLPINGCIGNHEYEDDATPRTYFDKYWPYPYVDHFYWSFDYGPVHITVIDQEDTSYAHGSAQYNWLRNDLRSSDKEWKILQLHEPGYSAGHHDDNGDVQNWIQPLCEEYEVDIVFCGHNHYYARCDKNGIKHITSGGGGAPLRDGSLNYSEYVEVYEKTYHFCKIDIRGKELTFEAVKPDGTVIDHFVLQRPPAGAWEPSPADGAVNQSVDVVLGWNAGDCLFRHSIYLGEDPVAVKNAGRSDPEWKYYYNPGEETFDPDVDGVDPQPLELWKTYYWRVDEIHRPYPVRCLKYPTITKGAIWSFTTGCELEADISRDCVVDFRDFTLLAEDWAKRKFFPDDF